jgi:polyisoprenoid-binding protein YceI
MIARLAVALAACGIAQTADAEAWQGGQDAGSLQFTAVQAGATFTGAFDRFQVRFDFDAAQPAGGRLDVTVATPSIATRDPERDEILRSRDFFWTEKFPEATFHASRFERDGVGWRASGELTIRGETRPTAVHFELAPGDRILGMKGSARLHRLEFGLGQGEWSSTEWVGDEVGVKFDLRLKPAPATAKP